MTRPVSLQRRLFTSMLGLIVVFVVLVAIPLGLVGTALVRSDAEQEIQRDADAIALALQLEAELANPFTSRQLRVFARDAQRVTIEGRGVTRTVERGFDDGGLTATARNSLGDLVTVETSDRDLNRRVLQVWLVVAGLAVAAILVASGVASRQARRLAEPMTELAVASDQLGRGDFSPSVRRFGVAEIDAVGEALEDSGRRLDALVTAEREFSSNAGHQLRTAITALRLQMDELELALGEISDATMSSADTDLPTPHQALVAAQAQVDRLEAVVRELMALARAGRVGTAERVDLLSIVEAVVARWRPQVEAEGRAVHVVSSPEPPGTVEIAAGAVDQALDTLLANAASHGAGRIQVEVSGDARTSTIAVTDEGAGVAAADLDRVFERGFSVSGGPGLGLSLARNLVEAEGGRLTVDPNRPNRFEIRIPGRPPPGGHR